MDKDKFLNLHGSINNDSDDEDKSTLVPNDFSSVEPTSVMYIPEEGTFSGDSNTLIDGSSGSSSGHGMSRGMKESVKSSIQQLQYNENKIALDRAINQTVDILSRFATENKERPMFYPTEIEDDNLLLLNSAKAHLALVRNSESAKTLSKSRIVDEEENLPEFKVLKISLNMGHSRSGENITASLDKKAIATLLTQKINQQIKYLLNLKDRVDDTSSKVFVTGDLNAGKSTFCNALLRRKVLPEDQQPCTAVFSEVIDAKINGGIEEVHAVPIGKEYHIRDESSYEIHPLKKLEDLVYECDKYTLLNIYVDDHRSLEESLLRNGVIDIKLIDAPGLNMDLYQTTQVFSRQEEIDLVVFVVSSENHFTLSAKEFIATAAAEKRYVFIVVNRFDNIKDKEKCVSRILDQVKSLSPDTYKSAKDFIHFVSSSEVLEGSGPGSDPDDGGDDSNNDNRYTDPNFDHLESALRKFLLEKRAISKLLPAKNYLKNILNDLVTLSTINEKIYVKEKEVKTDELKNTVNPKFDKLQSQSIKVNDMLNKLTEDACAQIYDHSKKEIIETVRTFGDKPIVNYLGLQYLYEYAYETQRLMLSSISSSVLNCEQHAKSVTTENVQKVIQIGQDSLGTDFLNNLVFNSDLMFSRKKDLIKNIQIPIEIDDFFDPSLDSCLMWLGIPVDYLGYTKRHVTYFSPITTLTNLTSNIASFKSLIPLQLTLHTLYSSGKILTTGALIRKVYTASSLLRPSYLKKAALPILIGVAAFAAYYLINDIPNAFPRKQARKIKKKIEEMEYAHINATRISKECRQVLNYPIRQVMNNYQTTIDKRSSEKADLEKAIKDADISYGYFHKLLTEIEYQRDMVNLIDIENMNTVD